MSLPMSCSSATSWNQRGLPAARAPSAACSMCRLFAKLASGSLRSMNASHLRSASRTVMRPPSRAPKPPRQKAVMRRE